MSITMREKSFCDEICNRKRWLFLTSILVCAVVGCGGYIMYLKLFAPSAKEIMLRKFEGVFYTNEEIERMNSTGHIARLKDPETGETTTYCSFSCGAVDIRNARLQPANNEIVTDRAEDLAVIGQTGVNNNVPQEPPMGRATGNGNRPQYFHGCCVSRPYIRFPNRLRTETGRAVKAVHLGDRRQIFWEEECRQTVHCSGCTCTRLSRQQLAFVVDDDGTDDFVQLTDETLEGARLEPVRVPGCCKCMNS